MKKLIVVVGCNRSGTSAVAKFLLENGAITGFCDEDLKGVGYHKFEDKVFKAWCQQKIGMLHETAFLQKHLHELKDYPIVMFKYPKAAFVLDQLIGYAVNAGRELEVIWVLRNPMEAALSAEERDAGDMAEHILHYCGSWDAMAQWFSKIDIYPLIIEYFMKDVDYRGDLLRWLGFSKACEPSAGIDLKKFKRRMPSWKFYNIRSKHENQ